MLPQAVTPPTQKTPGHSTPAAAESRPADNSNIVALNPARDDAPASIAVRSKSAAVVVLAGAGDAARVLLMQRAGKTSRGLWSLVMGGMELGETASQAAVRELAEETAIAAGELFNSGCCDTFYNPKSNTIDITPIFVARFAVAPQVTIDQEHLAFYWASFAEAQEMLAFPGQRQALVEIERDFARREPRPFRLIKA